MSCPACGAELDRLKESLEWSKDTIRRQNDELEALRARIDQLIEGRQAVALNVVQEDTSKN